MPGAGVLVVLEDVALFAVLSLFAALVLGAILWAFSRRGSGKSSDRPLVNAGQLLLSLIFSPLVLPYWAITSIGLLASSFLHLLLGGAAASYSFFASLVGGAPLRTWRAGKRQFRLALRDVLEVGASLLTCFGFRGLVLHLRDEFGAKAPRAPPLRSGERSYPFEDRYRIESHLGSGGSTALLFVVRRVAEDRASGERGVLKYFDLGRGSRLEEVIRESRGMQVAKEMGIVLDHQLARDHFYYVMPYHEGETLTRAAARIHRRLATGEGLSARDADTCLDWVAEILRILDGYHRHGVIHKDVKPDNIIVTGEGLRLVDLGLLTPLTSALTLTTHGTEYFRDPEMVRLSIQGRRVRDVEAVRFDIYSIGAVLYLLFEASFPACGPLSRYSRPVPMAVSWITSRAMAEGKKRYPSIAAMRADLEGLRELSGSRGLDGVPASLLPSFSGFESPGSPPPPPPRPVPPSAAHLPPAPSRSPVPKVARLLVFILVLGAAVLAAIGIFDAPPSGTPEAEGLMEVDATFVRERVRDWWGRVPPELSPPDRPRVVLVFGGGPELRLLAERAGEALSLEGFEVASDPDEAGRFASLLRSSGDPRDVREGMGDLLRDDTGTFVTWVALRDESDPGKATRRVVVRGYYRTLAFTAEGRLPASGSGDGP